MKNWHKWGYRIGVTAAIIFNFLDYFVNAVRAIEHRALHGHWPRWSYRMTIWGPAGSCTRCEVGEPR